MSQDRAYLRRRAAACMIALGYLARINLTGLDAPTDTTATELADNLWREAGGDNDAPEYMINACYRALENANG